MSKLSETIESGLKIIGKMSHPQLREGSLRMYAPSAPKPPRRIDHEAALNKFLLEGSIDPLDFRHMLETHQAELKLLTAAINLAHSVVGAPALSKTKVLQAISTLVWGINDARWLESRMQDTGPIKD